MLLMFTVLSHPLMLICVWVASLEFMVQFGFYGSISKYIINNTYQKRLMLINILCRLYFSNLLLCGGIAYCYQLLAEYKQQYVLIYRSQYLQISSQVMKRDQKNKQSSNPKPEHVRPSRSQSRTSQPLSQPKNAPKLQKKTGKAAPMPVVAKEQVPKPSANQIINNVLSIDLQHLSFEDCMDQLTKSLLPYFKFKLIFMEPISPIGEQIYKNGKFTVAWLKIVSKCPFINMHIIQKSVRDKQLQAIAQHKDALEQYLNERAQAEARTPIKPSNMKENAQLKRSILKTSERKVQFGKNQILYPSLEPYKPVSISSMVENRRRKKEESKSKQGYLLDYFEINDVYLLEEVEIVGVLKQIDGQCAIILAKDKATNKEITCIGVPNSSTISCENKKVLDQLYKHYENLAYVEFDGKSVSELWVDSLPSEKQK